MFGCWCRLPGDEEGLTHNWIREKVQLGKRAGENSHSSEFLWPVSAGSWARDSGPRSPHLHPEPLASAITPCGLLPQP